MGFRRSTRDVEAQSAAKEHPILSFSDFNLRVFIKE